MSVIRETNFLSAEAILEVISDDWPTAMVGRSSSYKLMSASLLYLQVSSVILSIFVMES